MIVGVSGTRIYSKTEHIRSVIQSLPDYAKIIAFGAIGPEMFAEVFAGQIGLQVEVRRKSTSEEKNNSLARLISDCDFMIIFWDGVSQDMIRLIRFVRNKNKSLIVYGLDGRELYCDENNIQLPFEIRRIR